MTARGSRCTQNGRLRAEHILLYYKYNVVRIILYLITSRTPGLERFRVMSTAVHVVVFVEVYEVDEYLFAHATREARRMPRRARPDSGGRHRHVAGLQGLLTLWKKRQRFNSKYT